MQISSIGAQDCYFGALATSLFLHKTMGSVAESGAVTPSSGKKYGRNNNNMKSGIRRESGATCKRLGNAKSSGSCSGSAPGGGD